MILSVAKLFKYVDSQWNTDNSNEMLSITPLYFGCASCVRVVRVLSRRVEYNWHAGSVAHIKMAVTPAQTADLRAGLCAVRPILLRSNSTRWAIFDTSKLNFHLETCLFSVGREGKKSRCDWLYVTSWRLPNHEWHGELVLKGSNILTQIQQLLTLI